MVDLERSMNEQLSRYNSRAATRPQEKSLALNHPEFA
jgi:hypothetical protein